MGETFAGIASSGPLLLAIGVAALAGLVSFLSPCVLPLVPGYLSYVTGLAGADLADALDRPSAAGPRAGRSLGVGGCSSPAFTGGVRRSPAVLAAQRRAWRC